MTDVVRAHPWLKEYLDGLDVAALQRLAKGRLEYGIWGDSGRGCLVGVARGRRRADVLTAAPLYEDEEGYGQDIRMMTPSNFDNLAMHGVRIEDTRRSVQAYVRECLDAINADRFLAEVYSNRPALREPAMVTKLVTYGILLLAAFGLTGCTTSVDSTEHCTLTRYGTITERKMETGLHWTPVSTATCFSMVDHNFPANKDGKEVISAQTADPVTIDADLSVIYSYDPATIDSVFLEKRSAEQAEIEVLNAVRAGYRNAVAGWRVDQIFSNHRPALDDSVRLSIQRKIGRKAIIKQVFLRDIRAPRQIEEARIAAAQQAQVLDRQQKQFTIDSVKARSQVIEAKAEAEAKIAIAHANAEATRLTGESYQKTPALLRLETARAMAGICAEATTCILGQQFLAGQVASAK